MSTLRPITWGSIPRRPMLSIAIGREGMPAGALPGAYYGYAVTRVGWLKRITGDEYELHGARTVVRQGARSAEGINKLASDGPGERYRLSDADKLPEEVHRLTWRRCLPADVEAWATDCPRPKDWKEEA